MWVRQSAQTWVAAQDADRERQRVSGPEDDFGALVRRAREYDRDAFGELYQRSLGPVYRYCRARVESTPEAEELTQEVFMAALAGIEKVRAEREAAWLAWLFQIARNKHADALRRRYRRPQATLEAAGDAVDGAAPALDGLVAEDTRAEVRRALDQLTAEQREVVIGKYVLGFDNTRIGELLGKNANAVNQLHFRAVTSLRKLLRDPEASS